ncbi:MAG: DUF1573 domain-containing protein [Saprospirales bacterium]|nr:MAG: DUF1573 domain-containing protein [Saprospirales bacterium]
MKSLFLTALMVLGFSAIAIAQSEGETKGPELTLESETLEYGVIERGADGLREIKFTNTGDEPLLITNTRGSCGCTVPSSPKDPILPGETGIIEVKYDTNRLGRINKSVTIFSNAGNPVRVRLNGEVKRDLEAG